MKFTCNICKICTLHFADGGGKHLWQNIEQIGLRLRDSLGSESDSEPEWPGSDSSLSRRRQ